MLLLEQCASNKYLPVELQGQLVNNEKCQIIFIYLFLVKNCFFFLNNTLNVIFLSYLIDD